LPEKISKASTVMKFFETKGVPPPSSAPRTQTQTPANKKGANLNKPSAPVRPQFGFQNQNQNQNSKSIKK